MQRFSRVVVQVIVRVQTRFCRVAEVVKGWYKDGAGQVVQSRWCAEVVQRWCRGDCADI